jgi:hypothetical protein
VGDHSFYVQQGGSNYLALNMDLSSGVYNIYCNSSTPTSSFASGITVGNWTHVSMVRSGSTITLYTNGVAKGTITNSSTLGFSSLTLNRFGGGNTGTRFMSNVRITKSAIYTANFVPPTTALTNVANTVVLTYQNATAIDNSSNGYTLTATGSPSILGGNVIWNANVISDASGNKNHWTPNNLNYSLYGTTYDAMTDSPTLTSATVANYCTLNPLSTTSTLANANLTYSSGATYCQGTQFPTSGLFYAEIVASGPFSSHGIAWGVIGATANMATTAQPGATTPTGAYLVYSGGGLLAVWSNTSSTNQTNPFTVGQTWQIALDVTTGYMYLGQNNTWYSPTMAATGNPSTGANPTFTLSNLSTSGGFSVLCGNNTAGGTFAWNFGQRPFTYTPPTGFVRLNTYNLPDSTIKKGNSYFDVTTYTGDGTTKTFSNFGFTPDFVWTKSRSNAISHILCDRVRGNYLGLSSDLTGSEGYNNYTQFNSAGSNSYTQLDVNNANTYTYVNWLWRAGNTSGSSNTSGNVTSTVSVNATAGFSIVTYTVTSTASMTIGHGLGVAPKMIIEKTRGSAANWDVYTESTGNTGRLQLNSTAAFQTQAGVWNNTSPTSTVFSQQGNGSWHPIGTTCVAYCWAEIAGFSKFGSYTGNGSTNGPFIYLGFRPKYLMVKRTNDIGEWGLHDTARDTYNTVNKVIFAHASTAEIGSIDFYDFTANGFKIRSSNDNRNASGSTYIYAAFAENPFKNANAR